MPAQTYTGDFEIVNLLLTTVDGQSYNLRFVMVEINVYEDLWSNQITCDLLVNDATNMIQNLPILGFETLLLEFRAPNKELWSKTLRLVRITDRKLMRERQAGYILHFVTPEAVNNMKVRVSKSYKGKLISEMVDDLHNTWLGGSAINIEPTKYQHHIIIPKLWPCHAINWLCTHANPAAYEGANYLYYQDKNKFQFVPVEKLLSQGPSQTYLFQVANIRLDSPGHKSEDFATNTVAAQVYTFDHYSDVLDNMQSGMYGNELYTHSHSRKLWKRYTFDYPDDFDKYKHLYQSNSLFSKKFGDDKPDSKLKLHSTGHDQDGYPFLPEKWIPPRISQLQQLQNIKLSITIPGDSERTVGQIVEFRFPSPEPPQKNQQIDDKYYAGKFLVQSIRHKIDANKYVTIMTLVKDSTKVQYPQT